MKKRDTTNQVRGIFVSNAIKEGVFALSHLENPRLEIEVLLCEVLGFSRSELITKDQETITDDQYHTFIHFLTQRANNVPVAYITGKKQWFDLTIQVDENVLIPRDETETLCRYIIEANTNPASIVDIGTGSGCIALAMKRAFPNATVTGVDISDEALKIAEKNSELNKLSVQFKASNLLKNVHTEYEIIIANLPYIPESMEVSKEVQKEPNMALFSGNDGLNLIRELATQIKPRKFKQLWLEFLPQQELQIKEIFSDHNVQFLTDEGKDVFFAKITP